jgi:hypothetical protein
MLSRKHRDRKKKGGMLQTNIKQKKQGSTKEILDAWTTNLEVQSPVSHVQDPIATLVRGRGEIPPIGWAGSDRAQYWRVEA